MMSELSVQNEQKISGLHGRLEKLAMARNQGTRTSTLEADAHKPSVQQRHVLEERLSDLHKQLKQRDVRT